MKILLIIIILTTALDGYATELLPPPALLSSSGAELVAINALDVGEITFAFDVTNTTKSISGAKSWTIYMINIKKNRLAWSQSGSGNPPARIAWDGYFDDGAAPDDGQKLGIKLVLQSSQGVVQSKVLEVLVVKKRMLGKLDLGIHFQPRSGFGMLGVVINANDESFENPSYKLFPVVATGINFHINRTHFLGLELESASNFDDSIAADGTSSTLIAEQYSSESAHYVYRLMQRSRKKRLELEIGAEVFRVQVRYLNIIKEVNSEVETTKYGFQVDGAAILVRSRIRLWQSVTWDLMLRGGAGLNEVGGTLQSGASGFGVAISHNLDLRTFYEIQEIEQKTGQGHPLKVSVSKAQIAIEMVL